tara:strand:+ start:352 stop:561 length:210 start_codon:yes stop_codon:yes gene_type:complete
MKIDKRLGAKSRKPLYVEVDQVIYDWIHKSSNEKGLSKAKFLDDILRSAMLFGVKSASITVRSDRDFND